LVRVARSLRRFESRTIITDTPLLAAGCFIVESGPTNLKYYNAKDINFKTSD